MDGTHIKSYIKAGNSLIAQGYGYYLFYKNTRTGAKYDIKNQAWFRDKYRHYDIVWRKMKLRYDDPGNIVFGYFAAASNMPVKVAQFGPGIYQMYSTGINWHYVRTFGDDPRDCAMIEYGYRCSTGGTGGR